MDKKKKTILVPWDYTDVAENAFEHAVRLVRKTSSGITIIHITGSNSGNDEALATLSSVAAEKNARYKIPVNAAVKTGSIFSSIREFAEKQQAILVVMGTHGIKGIQKLTGSRALKVIANSRVPFLVVQEKPERNTLSKIVLPVDFSVENKEKLIWANYIAGYFKIKVYLFVRGITDEVLLRKTKANLSFARKYLIDRVIDYEIKVSREAARFHEQTIGFAKEIDADMIMIMTTKAPSFTDYMFGSEEQLIIANNAKIPVMCVNPRTDVKTYQGFH